MQNSGVSDANPNALNWEEIIQSDTLYTQPISVIHEIYDNTKLAEWLMTILKKMRKEQ